MYCAYTMWQLVPIHARERRHIGTDMCYVLVHHHRLLPNAILVYLDAPLRYVMY